MNTSVFRRGGREERLRPSQRTSNTAPLRRKCLCHRGQEDAQLARKKKTKQVWIKVEKNSSGWHPGCRKVWEAAVGNPAPQGQVSALSRGNRFSLTTETQVPSSCPSSRLERWSRSKNEQMGTHGFWHLPELEKLNGAVLWHLLE